MRETKVNKNSPAIRKILSATVGPKWTGTYVVVRELPSTWRYTGSSTDSRDEAWFLDLSELFGTGVTRIREPPMTRSPTPYRVEHLAPHGYDAIVRLVGQLAKRRVEIIISDSAIDSSAIAVATDALLTRDKSAAREAAGACGVTADLCMALAEAHARALMKGEAAGDLTATLASTAQTPSAKRAKKTAAQLDREIAAALSRR